MPILVIVESPGKIKKISEFLGDNYIVKASFGHCRDLDPKSLSIDVDNNFRPSYKIINGKNKVVRELRGYAQQCSEVILAADEDREGEMIAASLADLLKLKNPKRLIFHEITEKALLKAIENTTVINQDMVNAQQARRILDRLLGYKLTPLLWKTMSGQLSAGRVQSVVVKIIIDKETTIENSVANPYFKVSGDFSFQSQKINSVLSIKNKQKHFEKESEVLGLLTSINKDTVFKVNNVENKRTERKPSAPFITSTMQQDASTKLKFNCKRTMQAAQKLYEAGYITYMRTDSTILSKSALKQCKKYIVSNYGEEYHCSRSYKPKSKNAQEAHEAIRPTKIKVSTIGGKLDQDCQKLYVLIWKRTVASQMANAIINIQTVLIDGLNKDKSILPKNSFFRAIFESIIFDGFLKLYNTYENENSNGKVEIKNKDIVKMKKIKGNQEYTKPPLRFNEAGLVKHLEKNDIGRPSTYASIISKIIDRKYVEIKNVDGFKKKSISLELGKSLKVKRNEKDIVIGREKNKIVPTEMGKVVNKFLDDNFHEIMKTNFTSNMEKALDKIAEGKAVWYNVVNNFYQAFQPTVEKLSKELENKASLSSTDKIIGYHPKTKKEIYTGVSKFGPYVKILDEETNKWKYAPLKNKKTTNVTVEDALELLKFPIYLGKNKDTSIYLHRGQYGLYLKTDNKTFSIKDKNLTEDNINLKIAIDLLEGGDPYALQTFTIKKKKIHLKQGPFGHYLQFYYKKKKTNLPIPQSVDIDSITVDRVIELMGGNVKEPVLPKKKKSKKYKTKDI